MIKSVNKVAWVSILTLLSTGCATTNYAIKNPETLSNRQKLYAYNQSLDGFTETSSEHLHDIIISIKKDMTPDDYLLFSYLTSRGIGISYVTYSTATNPEQSPNLVADKGLMKIAHKTQLFKRLIYCNNIIHESYCSSRLMAYNGRAIINKNLIESAASMAKTGDNIACKFIFQVYCNGDYDECRGNYRKARIPTNLLLSSLSSCTSDSDIQRLVKNERNMIIDRKYRAYFQKYIAPKMLQNEIKKEKKNCAGVSIPNKISLSFISNSISYIHSPGPLPVYPSLNDYKWWIKREWLAGEKQVEFNYLINGYPFNPNKMPVIASSVCTSLKNY